MSAFKCVLPLLLLASFFSGTSHAQTSLSLYKTTYHVQVQYEMWRNGSTYWATEYETSDLADAQMLLQLFEAALNNGTLSEIMGAGPEWIAVDVRMTTKKEWLFNYEPLWIQSATIRR